MFRVKNGGSSLYLTLPTVRRCFKEGGTQGMVFYHQVLRLKLVIVQMGEDALVWRPMN